MDRFRRPTATTSRVALAVATAVLCTAAGGAGLAGCGSDAPPPAPPPAVGPSTIPVTPPAPPSPAASSGPDATASAGTSAGASAAPITAVTTPAPGRGAAADRVAVENAFRSYLRAVADGDFAAACALNAPETNQRLLDELARRGTPASTCEQAIATLYTGSGVAEGAATIANTLSVERVDVDGDAASVAWSVEVSGRRPVVSNMLRRVDGQWRLLPTPDPAG